MIDDKNSIHLLWDKNKVLREEMIEILNTDLNLWH